MDLQTKWDARYRDADADTATPAAVLIDNAHLLPENGRALDFACGLGGNAQWLAKKGLEVDAWDLSPVAVAKLKVLSTQEGWRIRPAVRDVENEPIPVGAYDVIAISYFLDRTLCGALSAALKPGGLLFYQTFTRGPARTSGPSNPDYLLKRNELLRLFAGLYVVAYREDDQVGAGNSALRGEAWLVAERSGAAHGDY